VISQGFLQQQFPNISAAIKLMEQHIDEPLSIEGIALQLQLSRRTLEKHFKAQLNISPQRYYKRMRMQIAKRLVVDSSNSLQEIALRTGFSSSAVFSREFKIAFGHSPSFYRKQYI